MKKGISIGIIIVIIGIGVLISLGSIELDTNESELVEETSISSESIVEEIITPEGKNIKISISDGIGAGDK